MLLRNACLITLTIGRDVQKIPNLLTTARALLALIVFVLLLYAPGAEWLWVAFAFFGVASLFDYLDGVIARRYRIQSEFGRVMDPTADKLLILLTLIGLVTHSFEIYGEVVKFHVLCVGAIIAREIFISGLREGLSTASVLAVTRMAKWKTVVQMLASISWFLSLILSHKIGHDITPFQATNDAPDALRDYALISEWMTAALLGLASILSWTTAWGYFKQARRVWNGDER